MLLLKKRGTKAEKAARRGTPPSTSRSQTPVWERNNHGSARLDLFRKTGDALIGRYFLFNLFPLSLAEMDTIPLKELSLWQVLKDNDSWSHLFEAVADVAPISDDLYEQYYEFGPFPKPLLKADKGFSNLWHRDYLNPYLRSG